MKKRLASVSLLAVALARVIVEDLKRLQLKLTKIKDLSEDFSGHIQEVEVIEVDVHQLT